MMAPRPGALPAAAAGGRVGGPPPGCAAVQPAGGAVGGRVGPGRSLLGRGADRGISVAGLAGAEGDRKAYYETSQWTIKQNRETIIAAKEEVKDLRNQLSNMRIDMSKKGQRVRARLLSPPPTLLPWAAGGPGADRGAARPPSPAPRRMTATRTSVSRRRGTRSCARSTTASTRRCGDARRHRAGGRGADATGASHPPSTARRACILGRS